MPEFQVIGVIYDSRTADPGTPVEGQTWFNSTEGRLKVFQSASTKVISTKAELDAHIADIANPHSATLEQARSAGATFAGDFDMAGFRALNMGGSANTDGASRQFVIDQIAAKLAGLDWQESVLDKDLSTPPVSPAVGDRYIVAPTGLGAWATHDNEIAEWNGTIWVFAIPDNGTVTKVEDENLWYMSDGAAWSIWNLPLDHGGLLGLSDDDHTIYMLASGARAMTGDLDMGTNNIINVNLVDGVDVPNHDARHERAGADEIDGDHLDIDFTPLNYTPDLSPPEATSLDDLASHLKGIDNLIGSPGLTQKGGRELAASFAGNPKTSTITFAGAFATTNYHVQLTVEGTTSFAPRVDNKTTGGFDINMGANNISGLVLVGWLATADGET